MAWEDELYDDPADLPRQTGTDWLKTISEKDQDKKDRLMRQAERKMRRAERQYLRKMTNGS